MRRSYGVEWRKSHEATRYPFSERASLTNGQNSLLEGTFVDAHIYPIGGQAGLYLRSVEIDYDRITFTIADDVQDRCYGEVNIAAPEDNVQLTDAYSRPAGILISQAIRLAAFVSWGTGLHLFEQSDTEFAATCCMPTPEYGVRGILLADGSLITGDIWLVGDNGIVLRHATEYPPDTPLLSGQIWQTIRVDVVGDPLFRQMLCEPVSLFSTVNPVRKVIFQSNGVTISECTPDAFGNLNIQRSDLLRDGSVARVRATSDGLLFEVVGDTITGAT